MDVRTICAGAVDDEQPLGRPMAPVIVPSSTFRFEDQQAIDRYYQSGEGYVYSRYGNPTVRRAEQLLAELEGAEDAVCFSSGMAAITTAISTTVRVGARVAAQRETYGGTTEYLTRVLPRSGVEVEWLSVEELSRLEPSRLDGCRLLYLETPTNPTLRVVDLERVSAIARQAGVITMVDATFATPALQRPLEQGIDLVVHSATKYLGGHGDLIGGVVAGNAESTREIRHQRRMLGGTMDPFTAFLLHRGMRTLAVRMAAHCRGAQAVARFLEEAESVDQVHYPGLASHPHHELARRQMSAFGGMVSCVVAGGSAGAVRVHDGLQLFARAGSLGSIESLVSIPARMSHRHLDPRERQLAGVPDGMLRLSIGLEAPEDLIADLRQALAGS